MANLYGPKIVTSGLVLCLDAGNSKSYPGTGTTWNDLSGNGNNGTLTNGPTFNSANRGSIVLDGTNDYIILTRMVADNFTLCLWFNTTSTSPTGTQWHQGHGLLDSEKGGITNDFGLSYLNNKAVLGVGSPDTTIQSTTLLNDGKWKYISATRLKSNGALAIFINGQQEITGTASTSSLNAQSSIWIGSSNGGVGSYGSTGGYVAGAHIYNRALSASEILQNYNATKGRFGL